MVGQCLFCSWYGIRLRRAPYLDGGRALYHAHCARIALDSPDPADRARAEEIFRAELPRVLRMRFWEINPPNRTVNPVVGVRDLSAEEFDRVCREQLSGPGDLLRDFLPGGASPRRPVRLPGESLGRMGELSGPGSGEEPPAAWGALQRALPEAAGGRPSRRAAATGARGGRRRRCAATPVDRALELVARFSGEELSQFRECLVGHAPASPASEDSDLVDG